MSKTYWKPHFVITVETINNIAYKKCGIKEVHYENGKPVMWTSNYVDVVSYEETTKEVVEQSMGLFKLYTAALDNVVYEEYIDTEDGSEKLRIYKETE